MNKLRVRIHFSKTGDLRWISHRDLARVWERLLRRAGLQLAFSEGFHPKPKISFPSALALGIVALDEIVEMDLVDPVDLEVARQKVTEQLPLGMEILEMRELPAGAGKAVMVAASYRVDLSTEAAELASSHLKALRLAGKVSVERDGKNLEADFSEPCFQIDLDGTVLTFTLPSTAQGSLRPSELLAALGIAHVLSDGAVLTRIGVQLAAERPRSAESRLVEVRPAQTGLANTGLANTGLANTGLANGQSEISRPTLSGPESVESEVAEGDPMASSTAQT